MNIPSEIEAAVKANDSAYVHNIKVEAEARNSAGITSTKIGNMLLEAVDNTEKYLESQEQRYFQNRMHRLTAQAVNRGAIGKPVGNQLTTEGLPVIMPINSVKEVKELVGKITNWSKEEYYGRDAAKVDVFKGEIPEGFMAYIGYVYRKFLPELLPTTRKGQRHKIQSIITEGDGKQRWQLPGIFPLMAHAPNLTRIAPTPRYLGMTDEQVDEFVNMYNYVTFKYDREWRTITAWFPGREENIVPCRAMDGSEDIVMLGYPNVSKKKTTLPPNEVFASR